MIITIDPGHKKNYNKGVIEDYREGNAMFTLAKLLEKELKNYEVEVVLTRGENDNPSLEERGRKAHNSKVFISLHSNYTSGGTAKYVCGFYSVKRKNSEKLCGELTRAIAQVMQETNAWSKGALTKKNSAGTDYYGVIRSSVEGNSRCEYSFIIEHGFHSDIEQCAWLLDEDNLAKLAKAEAEVLAKHLKLQQKPSKKYYRVQVGTYSDLSSAEEAKDIIQRSGFIGAYVTEVKPEKTIDQLADEIINGNWGTGHSTRKRLLSQAGWLDFYDYEEIRQRVNEKIGG